jgi:hypothetical protein
MSGGLRIHAQILLGMVVGLGLTDPPRHLRASSNAPVATRVLPHLVWVTALLHELSWTVRRYEALQR